MIDPVLQRQDDRPMNDNEVPTMIEIPTMIDPVPQRQDDTPMTDKEVPTMIDHVPQRQDDTRMNNNEGSAIKDAVSTIQHSQRSHTASPNHRSDYVCGTDIRYGDCSFFEYFQ